ncbi:MAG: extracellular solute-binding protein, partial [Chloroflexota bacterium]|nr:extracellular solute-binding protein [Chloroflexota bacterium]
MIRKIALIVSVMALFSFAFAASAQDMTDWTCGTVDGDMSGAITITGWEGPGEVDKFLLAFDEFFGEYYPNVEQILNTGVSWTDYWTTLPAQLAGGAEIDMAWMHDTRNDTFAANGWALNLDSYLEACPIPGWPESFVASQVDAFNYQGSQYAIPYDLAPGGLYI